MQYNVRSLAAQARLALLVDYSKTFCGSTCGWVKCPSPAPAIALCYMHRSLQLLVDPFFVLIHQANLLPLSLHVVLVCNLIECEVDNCFGILRVYTVTDM